MASVWSVCRSKIDEIIHSLNPVTSAGRTSASWCQCKAGVSGLVSLPR